MTMKLRMLAFVLLSQFGCDNGEVSMSSANRTPTVKNLNSGDQVDLSNSNVGGIDPAAAKLNIRRGFVAAGPQAVDTEYSPNLGLLTQELTLARKISPSSQNFSQITRSKGSFLATQSTVTAQKQDSFTQAKSGILDLVLVIDDSGSMSEEQAGLASKLATLVSKVNNADWRINIVTTDPTRGCSWKLITKPTDPSLFSQAETEFKDAIINAGVNGSGIEQGILQAVNGFKCPTTNWVRDASTAAVLIVSDEDNCSSMDFVKKLGGDCPGVPGEDWHYLTNYMTQSKANGGLGRVLGTDARVYGLINPPPGSCTSAGNIGYQYDELIKFTSGVSGKICDLDYSTTLTQISSDIANILRSQFDLSYPPQAGSLVVKVDGVQKTLNTDYTLTGKTITFLKVPISTAKIVASYIGIITVPTQTFSLTSSIPSGKSIYLPSLEVKVNDVVAPKNSTDPAGYTYDSAAKQIKFNQIPANGAKIAANFEFDDTLTKTFSLGTSTIKAGTLHVQVNGVEQSVSSTSGYILSGSTITINPPPPVAATISVAFDQDLGPQLEYPVNLIGTTPSNIVVTDKGTQSIVPATYSNGNLSVPPAEFVDGRVLSVVYQNEKSVLNELSLPDGLVEGSVTVDAGRSDCVVGQGVTVSGNKISLACSWGPKDLVHVHYLAQAANSTAFQMDSIPNPDLGAWRVWVADAATTQFSRTGSVITLATPPAAGTKVVIEYASHGF